MSEGGSESGREEGARELSLRGAAFVDAAVEADFRRYRYENELRGKLAPAAFSAVLLYVLLVGLDLLLIPDAIEAALWIRFGACVPLAVFTAALTLTRHAERWSTRIGTIHALMGVGLYFGAGAASELPTSLPYACYAVLFPILVPSLTRLDPRPTLGIAIVTVLGVGAIELGVAGHGYEMTLFFLMLFSIGCAYGVWDSYTEGLAARRSYAQQLLILRQRERLTRSLAELEEAQGELVEAQKMAALGQLVAGVAHELNTPLGIALTAATHLEGSTKEIRDLDLREPEEEELEELEESLEAVDEATVLVLSNVRRAAELVKQFKLLAIEQAHEDAATEIPLAERLRELIKGLRLTLDADGHQIEIDCPEELRIVSYEGPLAQVVTNLIRNSIHHGFEGRESGRIEISAREGGDQLVLVYRDDGLGMTKEVRARLFEPFFTTKRGKGGMGLGMHLVHNLVRQKLRGSIQCETAPGEGTTFTLKIPLHAVTHAATHTVTKERNP